ncbi:MAG: CDP-diacylglycerol--glycerol-3-phosphate 3-phosphatidyltransferase [Thermoleophilia bacterium]
MRSGLMNAPLWVTSVRIVAIPPLMVLLLVDGIPGARWWAFWVFAAACATDSLDGYLARSRGEVSAAGAFLDTLADKLLITAVLVSLVETQEVPAWVAMVIIAREFAVTGLRMVAAAENVIISAGRFGKAKAFSQNVALGAIIVPGISADAENVLLGIAIVLTVLSGVHYFLVARWRLFSDKGAADDAAAALEER